MTNGRMAWTRRPQVRFWLLVLAGSGPALLAAPAPAATPAPVEAAAPAAELPAAMVSQEQASTAALKALPGKVTDIAIERKMGRRVYVVEIVSAANGEEVDVLVDPQSAEVIAIEH